MGNNELVKKLEEFDEKLEHEISPCDLENNDYVQIKLNKKDALELKELLRVVLNQLDKKD